MSAPNPQFTLSTYFYDRTTLVSPTLASTGQHEIIIRFENPSGQTTLERLSAWRERVVTCVNACEGIEDPADYVAKVKRVLELVLTWNEDLSDKVRRDPKPDTLAFLIREAIELGGGAKFPRAPTAPSNPVLEAANIFNAAQGFPADHGPHSGDGALAVQEVHEAPKAEQCTLCGQRDTGQTGEYPCVECGLPTDHDRPRCTGQHPNCLGCDALRRKRDLAKKPPGSCL